MPDRVQQLAARVGEIASRKAQREAQRRRRRKLIGTAAGLWLGAAAGAVALRSSGQVESSVEVEVPVSAAYKMISDALRINTNTVMAGVKTPDEALAEIELRIGRALR